MNFIKSIIEDAKSLNNLLTLMPNNTKQIENIMTWIKGAVEVARNNNKTKQQKALEKLVMYGFDYPQCCATLTILNDIEESVKIYIKYHQLLAKQTCGDSTLEKLQKGDKT